jgi:hypothetical protein
MPTRESRTYLGIDVGTRRGANKVVALTAVLLLSAVLVGVARGGGLAGKALVGGFNGLLVFLLFVRPALKIRRLSGP